MIGPFLQNLPPVIASDPLPLAVANWSLQPIAGTLPASYWVTVRDGLLTGTNQAAVPGTSQPAPTGSFLPHPNVRVDLTTITLGQLAQTISAQPGMTLALLPGVDPTLPAWLLVEGAQDVVAQPQLAIAQSLLWALYRPLGLERLLARQFIDQMPANVSPLTASGVWLATLGDLYGLDRNPGEDDVAYRARLVHTLLTPRCDNRAMEDYLRWALGDDRIAVTDDTPAQHSGLGSDVYAPFRFFVDVPLIRPGDALPLDPATLYPIVQAIKAWGTIWALRVREESEAQAPPPQAGPQTWRMQIATTVPETWQGVFQGRLVATTLARVGHPLNVLRASVWRGTQVGQSVGPGYNPASGAIVISALSDPSVRAPGHDGTAGGSAVDSITSLFIVPTFFSARLSAPYGPATLGTGGLTLRTSVQRQQATSVGTGTIAIRSARAGQGWHPFRCSAIESRLSLRFPVLAPPPAAVGETPPTAEGIQSYSFFKVPVNGVLCPFSDRNHPALP